MGTYMHFKAFPVSFSRVPTLEEFTMFSKWLETAKGKSKKNYIAGFIISLILFLLGIFLIKEALLFSIFSIGFSLLIFSGVLNQPKLDNKFFQAIENRTYQIADWTIYNPIYYRYKRGDSWRTDHKANLKDENGKLKAEKINYYDKDLIKWMVENNVSEAKAKVVIFGDSRMFYIISERFLSNN